MPCRAGYTKFIFIALEPGGLILFLSKKSIQKTRKKNNLRVYFNLAQCLDPDFFARRNRPYRFDCFLSNLKCLFPIEAFSTPSLQLGVGGFGFVTPALTYGVTIGPPLQGWYAYNLVEVRFRSRARQRAGGIIVTA